MQAVPACRSTVSLYVRALHSSKLRRSFVCGNTRIDALHASGQLLRHAIAVAAASAAATACSQTLPSAAGPGELLPPAEAAIERAAARLL